MKYARNNIIIGKFVKLNEKAMSLVRPGGVKVYRFVEKNDPIYRSRDRLFAFLNITILISL